MAVRARAKAGVVDRDYAKCRIRGGARNSPVILEGRSDGGASFKREAGVKPVIDLYSKERFSKVMRYVSRTNPKYRKEMAKIATAVMVEAERLAAKHRQTGNFERHLKYSGPDKAGGWRIDATDKDAWHIEFGHFMEDEKTGVAAYKQRPDSELVKSVQDPNSRSQSPAPQEKGGSSAEWKDGRIWIEGLHIMRDAAMRVQAELDAPAPGRLKQR